MSEQFQGDTQGTRLMCKLRTWDDLLAACEVAYAALGDYGHAYEGPDSWDMMQAIKKAIAAARGASDE